MVTGAGRPEQRRPLWQEVGLTAALAATLLAFATSATWVSSRFLETANGVRLFPILVFVLAVPFLINYAYPPRGRRWYHWVGFELCVVLVVLLWIPLVYLPWLIVTRKAWRGA